VKTRIKEKLLQECNLHTIVRFPKSVFAPYTSIATNMLFFTKGTPTTETWFFEHPLPEGYKAYSKTKPMRIDEFDLEKEWWNNRVETENAWCVNIDEIKNRDYNLDIKNPNKLEDLMEDPEILLTRFKEERVKAQDLLEQLRAVLTEALLR
jgi:type I restriction enzyme M protein